MNMSKTEITSGKLIKLTKMKFAKIIFEKMKFEKMKSEKISSNIKKKFEMFYGFSR